jgi:hypothetical protein
VLSASWMFRCAGCSSGVRLARRRVHQSRGGGAPMCLSSGEGVVGLIEGAVAEHGVEDVTAAAGEGDEGLVVAFALSDLPVVVGA